MVRGSYGLNRPDHGKPLSGTGGSLPAVTIGAGQIGPVVPIA
jgi:hypothetical protein